MSAPATALRKLRLGGRLAVTGRARRAIAVVRSDDGPQHVVLDWPSAASVLPAGEHRVRSCEVIVGHLAECPIFVDLRQLVHEDGLRLLDIDPAGLRANEHRPRFALVGQ